MGDKNELSQCYETVLVSDPAQYSNPVQPHKQLQGYYAGIKGKQGNGTLRAASYTQTLGIVL